MFVPFYLEQPDLAISVNVESWIDEDNYYLNWRRLILSVLERDYLLMFISIMLCIIMLLVY